METLQSLNRAYLRRRSGYLGVIVVINYHCCCSIPLLKIMIYVSLWGGRLAMAHYVTVAFSDSDIDIDIDINNINININLNS